jgi:Tol biopolymer transport system component
VTTPHSIRRCSSVAALILSVGCSPGPRDESIVSAKQQTPTAYSIEDFYKSVQFRGAAWSSGGRKILVSSDLSGIWNAYTLAASGGPPQPLTQSKSDSVFALSYFPADERILYSSDEGGNELTHIYVQSPDGSKVDVTSGAKLKANFHGWAGDDRSFFVSTNERNPQYFDLYDISTDGYKRTLLYRNTDGFTLGPISRDKRYIALIKTRTTSDSDIFLHDRTRNTAQNITTHSGNVSNTP